MEYKKSIKFILNEREVELSNFSPNLTLLDFMRLDRGMIGTKEGCNEGDCGACSVLIGKIKNGKIEYMSANSCICFVGTLNGTHIITIEYLQKINPPLHPIQKAIIDYHGSQCGFCTPGIIMSLYGLFLQNPKPSEENIKIALQGNLCRCTGYAPIIRAAISLSQNDALSDDRLKNHQSEIIKKLQIINSEKTIIIHNKEEESEEEEFIIPANLDDFAKIYLQKPHATILAGGTDIGVWVNVELKKLTPLIYIGHLNELKLLQKNSDNIIFGSIFSYTELNKYIKQYFPDLTDYWLQIGSAQIRNMGTIGGNIANGSPIADLAPVLIGLNASLILRKGNKRRKIRVEDFYLSHNKQDLSAGEFIENIIIPLLKKNEHISFYKISKRKYEDISTISAALKIEISKGKIINSIFAFGGMAAIPKRAKKAEKILLNQPICEDIFIKSAKQLEKDFTPISDVRASKQYRMRIAQNLIRKFYLELNNEK